MPGGKRPLSWGLLLMIPSCRSGYEVLEQLGEDTVPAEQMGDGDGDPTPAPAGGASTTLGGGAPADGSGGATASGGTPAGDDVGAPGTSGAPTGLGGSAGAPYIDSIPDPEPPPAVSAGQAHTCGVSAAGDLFCWGSNASSALGSFVGADSPVPVHVGGEGDLGGFVGVAAGRSCACALRDDGTVWCWGSNETGQLGQGDLTDRSAPTQVPFVHPIRAVSLNFAVACAIDQEGQLFCWGGNAEGQAGQDDLEAAPIDSTSPLLIPSDIPWLDVSTGDGHVCAIRADGALHCWGRNSSGELGRETPIQLRTPSRVGSDDDWKLIRASQSQTCGIREDKSLWCWGAGDQGQLGIEPPEVRKTPSRVGEDNDWAVVEPQTLHTCGLKENGAFFCWGRRQEGQIVVSYDPSPVLIPFAIDPAFDWDLISAGRFHTCGRRAGVLHCTGENTDGRLGDGSLVRSYGFVPVQAF